MGLKQGYKQTEFGVIPDDWDIVDIDFLVENKIIAVRRQVH
jgi:hypothetical protein